MSLNIYDDISCRLVYNWSDYDLMPTQVVQAVQPVHTAHSVVHAVQVVQTVVQTFITGEIVVEVLLPPALISYCSIDESNSLASAEYFFISY